MPREDARTKAGRLLLEGGVMVRLADRRRLVAFVRGEGAVHRVAYDFAEWRCSCPHPGRTTDCSHVLAVKRIAVVDLEGRS